jgi:hypothetical protein
LDRRVLNWIFDWKQFNWKSIFLILPSHWKYFSCGIPECLTMKDLLRRSRLFLGDDFPRSTLASAPSPNDSRIGMTLQESDEEN